ncbi:MAG: Uma2 family endonuclease [Actinomycetota bacterium]
MCQTTPCSFPTSVAGKEDVLSNTSGTLDPADVLLAVEIVSPGSRTRDRVTKPVVCAQWGIPSYWRVEPDESPTSTSRSTSPGQGWAPS